MLTETLVSQIERGSASVESQAEYVVDRIVCGTCFRRGAGVFVKFEIVDSHRGPYEGGLVRVVRRAPGSRSPLGRCATGSSTSGGSTVNGVRGSDVWSRSPITQLPVVECERGGEI